MMYCDVITSALFEFSQFFLNSPKNKFLKFKNSAISKKKFPPEKRIMWTTQYIFSSIDREYE